MYCLLVIFNMFMCACRQTRTEYCEIKLSAYVPKPYLCDVRQTLFNQKLIILAKIKYVEYFHVDHDLNKD